MAVKVGVIGLGFMGRTHIEIYQKNKRAHLVAIGDIDTQKASGKLAGGGNLGSGGAMNFGPEVTSYKKPDELIADPRVEAVDLCVPTYLHAEYAVKALAAGKHVLCEKPLTVDLKDAQRVVKAARKSKSYFMPAHCMRFWPEWVWLKDAVKSKRYGKVHSAVFKRYASTPGWTSNSWVLQPELSGSALFDLHVHDADFIRYLFGDPKAVFAIGNGGKATHGGIDHVVSTYLYKDKNLLVAAEGGWNADPSYGFTMRYTVVFERATADFDLAREGKTLLLHKAGEKLPEAVKTATTNGWQEEIDYFLACIQKKRKPLVTTAADALASVSLLHAELKSIRHRKLVKL